MSKKMPIPYRSIHHSFYLPADLGIIEPE